MLSENGLKTYVKGTNMIFATDEKCATIAASTTIPYLTSPKWLLNPGLNNTTLAATT